MSFRKSDNEQQRTRVRIDIDTQVAVQSDRDDHSELSTANDAHNLEKFEQLTVGSPMDMDVSSSGQVQSEDVSFCAAMDRLNCDSPSSTTVNPQRARKFSNGNGRRSRKASSKEIYHADKDNAYWEGLTDFHEPPSRRRRSLEEYVTTTLSQMLTMDDNEDDERPVMAAPKLTRSDSWPPKRVYPTNAVPRHVKVPDHWAGDFHLGEWVESGSVENALRPDGLLAARQALLQSQAPASKLLTEQHDDAIHEESARRM